MIKTLSDKVSERKGKLSTFYSNSYKDISAEKRHQITGALSELDNILTIIKEHKGLEVHKENNPDTVFLLRPVQEKSFIANIKDFIKEVF